MSSGSTCVGEKRRRVDPGDAPVPDADLLKYTLEHFGATRERMVDMYCGRATTRSKLDRYMSRHGYRTYSDFATLVEEYGRREHYDANQPHSEFVSFDDFDEAVSCARVLEMEEDRNAVVRAMKEDHTLAKSGGRVCARGAMLDEHINREGYDTYNDFYELVISKGLRCYYDNYADCREFDTFTEFVHAVGLARELAGVDDDE